MSEVPSSSSSLLLSILELSDTKVYEPQIRGRLGTAAVVPEDGKVSYTPTNPHFKTKSMAFRPFDFP